MKRTHHSDDTVTAHLLGELEAAIMHIMWCQESATVRDVLEELNGAGRALAYTTVMTVMSRLTTKGLLTRELTGKTHRYRAALTEAQFVQRAAAERVHALIEDFGDVAITHFFAELDGLSPERRRQVERLARGDER